jgi:hypothetical protein
MESFVTPWKFICLLFATIGTHCWLDTICSADEVTATKLKQQFEAAAEQVKVFPTGDLVNNRFSDGVGGTHSSAEIVRKLMPGPFSHRTANPLEDRWFSSVVDLSTHKDPKVRTLAILALYHSRNPDVIDHLVDRLADDSPTFPKPSRTVATHHFNFNGLGQKTQEPLGQDIPGEDQTVASIAEQMLWSILAPSLEDWRLDPAFRDATMERFWQNRRGRKQWIGWYMFELDLATRSQSRIMPDTASLIRHVIQQIEQLAPIEQEITLLAIFGSTETRHLIKQSGYVVGEDMLRYAAMRLERKRLLNLIGGEALIDDPDLPKYLPIIKRYIYEHATLHLDPADYKTVLAVARAENCTDAFIAAARLSPANASMILREAVEAKQGKYEGGDRARVMTVLWQIKGSDEAEFIIDWFYGDRTPEVSRIYYRADILDFMLDRFNDSDRQMLARMIRDPRTDQLSLPEHRLLATKLQRNLLRPIIDPEEVRRLFHPLGDSHFDGQMDRAIKDYPQETRQVVSTLALWRARLRESLPQWSEAASQ